MQHLHPLGRRRRRILLVDGDESTRAALAHALRGDGYETREEERVTSAELAVEEFRPDLTVLEAVLPDGGDGFELARSLSERRSGMHLIFVTSRDRIADKVAGLALADDYLVKPVNELELMARLRAILRRTPGNVSVLRCAGIVLNTETRKVERGGEAVELTPREFDLLRLFLLNPGRVLSKEEILAEVWRESAGPLPGVVETYVGYLRRKLDASVIKTVRLAGYALRDFTNR